MDAGHAIAGLSRSSSLHYRSLSACPLAAAALWAISANTRIDAEPSLRDWAGRFDHIFFTRLALYLPSYKKFLYDIFSPSFYRKFFEHTEPHFGKVLSAITITFSLAALLGHFLWLHIGVLPLIHVWMLCSVSMWLCRSSRSYYCFLSAWPLAVVTVWAISLIRV